MGKKLKLKVKRGKFKMKLKSGDDRLPLSDAEVRGLLTQAMARAVGPGEASSEARLLTEVAPPPLLIAGDAAEPEAIETAD